MNKISLSASAAARILAVAAALQVFASIVGQFSYHVLELGDLKGFVPLFNLDHERNVPTYFSVVLILLDALLLAIITVLSWRQGTPHRSKWMILALGFLLMGCDEAIGFHERLMDPIRSLLGGGRLGPFYFAWTLPAIALVVVLGLYFRRFLLDLPRVARLRFLTAAALYLGGAIGVELIGGCYAEAYGLQHFTYSMITTVEESLEMAGLIYFLWALMSYCADNHRDVRIHFGA